MFKVYIILLIYFALVSCNGNGQQLETPKEFINHVTVGTKLYSKDSIAILSALYTKMRNHQESFTNSEYFDSTILLLDTIMYDSSLSKIAIFVIAKNPIAKNPYSDSKLPYYYNASCYLGKRKFIDSSSFELKQLGPFSLANFDSDVIIKQAIRNYFFLELATLLDEKNQPVFKYNLNDKRFWDSATGWRRMFK